MNLDSKTILTLGIKERIVDNLIGGLFFNEDDQDELFRFWQSQTKRFASGLRSCHTERRTK